MENVRKFDFKAFLEQAPQRNLQEAAKAYLHTAIRSYLKIEGQVSIWSDERFGDSANIVCSLNRAIEHLLKLRLLMIDPLLLYPVPKKIEEYCRIKQIKTKDDQETERRIKEREALSHTVSFKEALSRVDLTYSQHDYDFKCFQEIYSLRNSLEHHWDRNEEFLQKVVGQMSNVIIPQLTEFIRKILEEDPLQYFPHFLISEVETLDRAIEQGHSLQQQHRFEKHLRLYKQNPESARQNLHYPENFKGLAEEETEVKCPVCNENMFALWDWEADYDVSDGQGVVSGAFPDAKVLHCPNCNYFVDGRDITTYLPDGLEIEFDPGYDEMY